jgi:hypothetical protein
VKKSYIQLKFFDSNEVRTKRTRRRGGGGQRERREATAAPSDEGLRARRTARPERVYSHRHPAEYDADTDLRHGRKKSGAHYHHLARPGKIQFI